VHACGCGDEGKGEKGSSSLSLDRSSAELALSRYRLSWCRVAGGPVTAGLWLGAGDGL
jgi:hypothetical protein